MLGGRGLAALVCLGVVYAILTLNLSSYTDPGHHNSLAPARTRFLSTQPQQSTPTPIQSSSTSAPPPPFASPPLPDAAMLIAANQQRVLSESSSSHSNATSHSQKSTRRHQSRHHSAELAGGVLHATLSLRTGIAGTISDRFVCAALDWWPADKCDYGRCPWTSASMLSVDLDDPLLVGAAQRLSPFLLRLGGSLSDFVTFEEADGCVPSDPSDPEYLASDGARDGARSCRPAGCSGFVRDERLRVGFRDGCLSRARWDALVSFCKRVGCEIVLSINALRGRRRAACSYATGADVPCRSLRPTPPCCTNYTGGWDGSNAERFLRAAAARGDPIAALAYGNELGGHLAISARLPAAAYAEGLSQLEAIVESAWRGATRPAPLLLGPNAQLDEGWLADLLRAAPSLRVLTYHLYPLGA